MALTKYIFAALFFPGNIVGQPNSESFNMSEKSLSMGTEFINVVSDTMPHGLMTTFWLTEKEVKLKADIEGWREASLKALRQNAELAEKELRVALKRFEAAERAVKRALEARIKSVDARWEQLAVAARHYRLGLCCCSLAEPAKCLWKAFARGASHQDDGCGEGMMDYLDKIPGEVKADRTRSTTVDLFLGQCANSFAWKNQLAGKLPQGAQAEEQQSNWIDGPLFMRLRQEAVANPLTFRPRMRPPLDLSPRDARFLLTGAHGDDFSATDTLVPPKFVAPIRFAARGPVVTVTQTPSTRSPTQIVQPRIQIHVTVKKPGCPDDEVSAPAKKQDGPATDPR